MIIMNNIETIDWKSLLNIYYLPTQATRHVHMRVFWVFKHPPKYLGFCIVIYLFNFNFVISMFEYKK